MSVGGRGVTLKDIALATGMSTAAVSQALNDRGSMRPETRERIKAVAADLGYVPNRTAAALRSGRTMSVGYVMDAEADGDRARRWARDRARQLTTLVGAAAEHGFTVTVLPAERPELLGGTQIDLLYFPDARTSPEMLRAAISRGIPVVADDLYVDGTRGLAIRTGYDDAVRAGLDLLHRGGAERIALLVDEVTHPRDDIAQATFETWSAVHRSRPLKASVDPARRRLPRVVREVLDAGADAIFAACEDGPDIFFQLEEMRLVIPRDVQLVALCTTECDLNARLGVTHICVHPDLAAAAMFRSLPRALRDDGPHVVDLPWEVRGGATTRASAQSVKLP